MLCMMTGSLGLGSWLRTEGLGLDRGPAVTFDAKKRE